MTPENVLINIKHYIFKFLNKYILGERGPIGHPGLQGIKGESGVAGPEGSTVSIFIL